ncbi:MAG: hypothetical protein ACK47B_16275 [Armatimonadota bacterium]
MSTAEVTVPRTNSHVHLPPNFSAFDTVEQAVRLAAEQGLSVLGASNYYDYRVYRELADRARGAGIYPLFGIEIISLDEGLRRAGIRVNDPGNPGKYYVCGKGLGRIDPMPAEAVALLETIRRNDSARMARMTDRLAEVFAAAGLELGLDEAAVKAGVVRRHGCDRDTVYLQERHVAQAFQEALFARVPEVDRAEVLARLFESPSRRPEDSLQVQAEIRSHLMKAGKQAYVEETFVPFEHAHRLVLALGGIPCYATLADGTDPICEYETPVEALIEDIVRRRISIAELIPIRNRPDVLRRYVLAFREAGLPVTAGTEHNTPDLLPMEPTCLGGKPVPEELRRIFWEGACVVAAHQHRVSRGKPGFVDGEGALNPEWTDPEARIRAFAKEGAALIRAATGSGEPAKQ